MSASFQNILPSYGLLGNVSKVIVDVTSLLRELTSTKRTDGASLRSDMPRTSVSSPLGGILYRIGDQVLVERNSPAFSSIRPMCRRACCAME